MIKNLFYKMSDRVNSIRAMAQMKHAGLKLHLGHTKIIGREKGLPVHSLFIPPEYSEPMSHAYALMYNRLRTGHPAPPIISNLAITKACTCTCPHCYAAGAKGEDLSFEQWKHIIEQCQDAGMCSIVFTGGEPLLRQDIHKLIGCVDRTRSVPILFTNGEFLKQQAAELKKTD